jgi:putative holliday junction resolvase
MPIADLIELPAMLPPSARLLGLDIGTKTIGLALSDVLRTIASPYSTLRRTKFTADAAELGRVVAKEGVAALVLGLPINMDGSEGPRCQSIRQFQRNLEPLLPLPMVFWDERLSTAAVTRGMIEADLTRKRRAEIVDRAAAAYILQGALDRLRLLG